MANEARVDITGDSSGLEGAVKRASQSLSSFEEHTKSRFKGVAAAIEGVQARWMMLTGLLAGGAVFGKLIESTATLTEETENLAKGMGVSVTEAGAYKAAFEDVNVSSDEFSSATQKLAKNLRENEAALNKMGLKTRDSANEVRPLNTLFLESIELLNGYKAGTDRVIAGQVFFGKGFEMSSNLAKMNTKTIEENLAAQRELSSLIGGEMVANFVAYDNATDQTHRVMQALGQTIGNQLMPCLTDLANWFNSIGPAAVVVVKGSLGGLAAVFHGITMSVTMLWETLNAAVITMAEPIRALGASLYKVMTGDFGGAAQELKGISTVVSEAWSSAFQKIMDKADSTKQRLIALFGTPTDTAIPSGEGKSAKDLVKPSSDKKEKKDKDSEVSVMQFFELALAREKQYQSEKDALREYSKRQELAFWEELLTSEALNAKDRLAIEKKVADLTVQVRRDAAKQSAAVDMETLRGREQLALGNIEAQRAAAQVALNLEQSTKLEYLQREIDFEQKRYDIQFAAVEARAQLLAKDPNTSPAEMARIKNELLVLEQQHQIQLTHLKGNKDQHQQQQGGGAEVFGRQASQTMSQNMTQMLTRTQTWARSLQNIYKNIRDSFIQNMVVEPAMQWVASLAKMLAAKLGFTAADTAATTTAASTNMSTKVTEATVVGTANSVEAATGAASAMSSVPYIGPILAIAAFAAMLALTMGSLGNLKSAEGGYDIPSGVNPMLQAHEEEMVLPKGIANPLRALLAGGGDFGAGGGGTVVYNDHSGKLSDQDIKRKARIIAQELSKLRGDGWTPK